LIITKKNHRKKIAMLLLVAVTIMATGCTNNANNQVKQQGVRMQQAINSPQGTPIDNRVEVAKQAADKITQINGVKSANVLVTRRNAYVAAVVNTNQGQLTSDLENQIAQQVRSTDPNIQNVYVSTNPEFVNRVNKYVADVGQGRPVSGFVEDFTVMVNRIFPSAR
jgi:YhcN/YlaJ family sporulation lipoprotein